MFKTTSLSINHIYKQSVNLSLCTEPQASNDSSWGRTYLA